MLEACPIAIIPETMLRCAYENYGSSVERKKLVLLLNSKEETGTNDGEEIRRQRGNR